MKKMKFIPGLVPPPERIGLAWWFIFQENKLLVCQKPESLTLPSLMDLDELGLIVIRQHYLVSWIIIIATLEKWQREPIPNRDVV